MVFVWGSFVGYFNFDIMSVAPFFWEFIFVLSSTYTYVIFPRYEVHYGLGNTSRTVVFSNASPAIGAGDFVLLDSCIFENISDGLIIVDYSWDLYCVCYIGIVLIFIMICLGLGFESGDVGIWLFFIFVLKVYKSDGSGFEFFEGFGGGIGGEIFFGGGFGDCQQWNELNQWFNNIEIYFNGIGWDLNEFKDKFFDEFYKDFEVSQAQFKYDKAESDVNSIIDVMFIFIFDYIFQKFNIFGSGFGDGIIGFFMDFVGGLWWFVVFFVIVCGCWVVLFILYGKYDVKQVFMLVIIDFFGIIVDFFKIFIDIVVKFCQDLVEFIKNIMCMFDYIFFIFLGNILFFVVIFIFGVFVVIIIFFCVLGRD